MLIKIGNSLIRRHLFLMLLTWGVSVAAVSLLYERYSAGLLEEVMGERLSAQLAAAESRLKSFFDARTYQIETLSNHPALPAYVAAARPESGSEMAELLRVEADVPDLYGILFFNADGRIDGIVAGQAASGPPYWKGRPFDLFGIPVTSVGGMDIVGPVLPTNGQPGWFLMRLPLREQPNGFPGGSIALHVRLASVTELLGAPTDVGVLEPLLKTPMGYLDPVGQLTEATGELVPGAEIMPGWQVVLQVEPGELLHPFQAARYSLHIAALTAATITVFLFLRLAARLRRHLEPLKQGALAVAQGNFDHRIPVRGQDEISILSKTFNTMAEKLEGTLRQAVRMERMAGLGEFATALAHEVRNPLATMKTTVQALKRREGDAERHALLTDMEEEIDRVGRVMQDLLDYGRPRDPAVAPVSAHELLRRVQSLIAPSSARLGIELGVEGELELLFLVDADQMQQVLLNLLLNALQATERGGTVSLRARSIGRAAGLGTLEVHDRGIGIPAELLSRITDPFFTTKPSGTGLGLSISRQLVELNGGVLHIESTEGQGTTVRLSLPLARVEA